MVLALPAIIAMLLKAILGAGGGAGAAAAPAGAGSVGAAGAASGLMKGAAAKAVGAGGTPGGAQTGSLSDFVNIAGKMGGGGGGSMPTPGIPAGGLQSNIVSVGPLAPVQQASPPRKHPLVAGADLLASLVGTGAMPATRKKS